MKALVFQWDLKEGKTVSITVYGALTPSVSSYPTVNHY